MHTVLFCVHADDGDGAEALLAHHCAFAENGDVVRFAQEVEEQVDIVHLNFHFVVERRLRDDTFEGVAGPSAAEG